MNTILANQDILNLVEAGRTVTSDNHRSLKPDELVKPRVIQTPPDDAPKKNGRGVKAIIGIAAVAAVAAVGVYYQRFVAPFESTDDAFIEGDATPIAPQVAGQVVRLLVTDNQEVAAGDLLLEIDPREFQAKVDQAHASQEQPGAVQSTA